MSRRAFLLAPRQKLASSASAALRRRARALLLAALILAACGLLPPGNALAHGGHAGPMQTFTQLVGPYELAVTVEIPSAVPAPLYLDIAPQVDVAGATMLFRAVPLGQPFDAAPVAQVNGMAGPQGVYYSQLEVDRAGEWELEVRANGPRGSGSARIPFTIPPPQGMSLESVGLFVALGGLVVLMIASIVFGLVAQRRGRPAPGWINWVLGQAMFACLIAAAIFGVEQFSASIQSAQAAAAAAAASGRPHANMAIRLDSAAPQAGQPLTLTLALSDGSTGLPIDDLISHHDALLHLVVISADGGYYSHMHPPRIGPGSFALALTPDRPGRYSVYAEIQRQDSGTQVLSRDFEVGGSGAFEPPQFAGPGQRQVDGMQVNVTSSLARLQAGRQTTFTFSFSKDGQPVDDLQPWLGMGGHMIARSADGAIFAHVHALGPIAPGGVLESGFVYGPDIKFVYTFPQPGSYQIWGQFRHAGKIVTVPLAVEVK